MILQTVQTNKGKIKSYFAKNLATAGWYGFRTRHGTARVFLDHVCGICVGPSPASYNTFPDEDEHFFSFQMNISCSSLQPKLNVHELFSKNNGDMCNGFCNVHKL